MAPAGSFHACLAANKLVNVFSAVLDVCVIVGKRKVQVLGYRYWCRCAELVVQFVEDQF